MSKFRRKNKVRIVAENGGHGFDIGQEVVICKTYFDRERGTNYYAVSPELLDEDADFKELDVWWVDDSEIVHA